MSAHEIDGSPAGLEEPTRTALEELRRTILPVIPDAEQGLSYGVPAFRIGGRPVAGFAAAKEHFSCFPHGGSVITEPAGDLEEYRRSKGTVRFPANEPHPVALVANLIAARLRELDTGR